MRRGIRPVGAPSQDRDRSPPHVEGAAVFTLAGGPGGAELRSEAVGAELVLRVRSPFTLLAIAMGALAPATALASGELEAEGALDALDELPALFDAAPDPNEPHHPQGA